MLSPNLPHRTSSSSPLSKRADTERLTDWREFRRSIVKGKIGYFRIKMEVSGFRHQWEEGIVGEGVFKSGTSTVARSKGRAGTPAEVSAEQIAQDRYAAEIFRRTSLKSAYAEVRPANSPFPLPAVIDFSRYFPHNIKTPKPTVSIATSAFKELCDQGRARTTRKYDGIGLTLVLHPWGWESYTLEGNRNSTFFPDHLAELNLQKDFQVGTILKAEGVIFDLNKGGLENLYLMTGTYGSGRRATDVLVNLQKQPEKKACIIVYDILYRDGLPLTETIYDERQAIVSRGLSTTTNSSLVRPVDFFPKVSPENWQEFLQEQKFEGFVVADGQSKLGKNILSYGTVPRAEGIYKLKDLFEEDVVIYAIRKDKGRYRSVFLKQRYPKFLPETGLPHPKAGQWFRCGRCSLKRRKDLALELRSAVKAKKLPPALPLGLAEKIPFENDRGITATIAYRLRTGEQAFRDANFGVPARFRWRQRSGDYKSTTECFAERFG